ncbi:MBL fold metallo-hydrolase [Desulfocurvus sp. DL9XJH121]
MKATVLVDNTPSADGLLGAEPGLSILVEHGGARVLLDCGYTDLFLKNAGRLGLELLDLDWVVLSHGHWDHTWGLMDLARLYFQAQLDERPVKRPMLLAHPGAFVSRHRDGLPEIGSLLTRDKITRHFPVREQAGPLEIAPGLFWLGEIPRRFDFEGHWPGSRMMLDEHGREAEDTLPDDSALACVVQGGLVIVAGCSHSGVCNIVEYAREVTGVQRVLDVLGGLHLAWSDDACVDATAAQLATYDLAALHACHCTGPAACARLARACPQRGTGAGTVIEYVDA